MYQRDLDRLQKIRSACTVCNGIGYKEVEKPDGVLIEDCACVQRIEKEIALIEANIPLTYRRWNMKKLNGQFLVTNKISIAHINKYIRNIDFNLNRGRGIWFAGPPGTAKSSMICYIMRMALNKKYSVYYDTASHLISLLFQSTMERDPEARTIVKNIIKNVHLLAIEEIDKRDLGEKQTDRHGSMAGKLFYQFLSDVYNAGLSLMISSNETFEETIPTLPVWIQDRFKSLMFITIKGASGREDMRNADS